MHCYTQCNFWLHRIKLPKFGIIEYQNIIQKNIESTEKYPNMTRWYILNRANFIAKQLSKNVLLIL